MEKIAALIASNVVWPWGDDPNADYGDLPVYLISVNGDSRLEFKDIETRRRPSAPMVINSVKTNPVKNAD